MTENQSKDKWCPMARYNSPTDYSTGVWNRGTDTGHGCCLGSECMAWRWTENDPNVVTYRAYGFCGLAGKP